MIRASHVSPRAFTAFSNLITALLLLVGLFLPGTAAAELKLEFIGFLAGLTDEAGLSLPPASTVTAQIELPLERGSALASFGIDFTPQTQVKLRSAVVRNGQLVKVRLVVRDGGLVVKRIREAEVGQFFGTVADLPDGALALPVEADQPITLLLGDLADLPLQVVITPLTQTGLKSLADGDPVAVKVTVVAGQTTALRIHTQDDDEDDLAETSGKQEKEGKQGSGKNEDGSSGN